jgi:hypothetical protein
MTVVIAQDVARECPHDAGLLSMNGDVFEENIATAATPDSGAFLPKFDSFSHSPVL